MAYGIHVQRPATRKIGRRTLIASVLGLGSLAIMRSDDLAPLFVVPRNSPRATRLAETAELMRYRKGTIETWNPETFANTVRFAGGAVMADLPLIGGGEAKTYAAGNVVAVGVVGDTWGILGRWVTPNTPEVDEILDRLSTELGERVDSADVAAAESTTSATFTDLATPGPAVTLDIGASGKALVIVSCRQVSTTSTPVMAYAISGATTVAADDADSISIAVTGGASQLGAASRVSLATGLNPGSNTFTAKYRRAGASTITFDQRNITVFAL